METSSKDFSSYSYAKENGILLDQGEVYLREDTPLQALLEMRRIQEQAFTPITLTVEAFDERLSRVWQQGSGMSQQMVDDMDGDIDLMALTEEIPDSEDLLDSDENSPVIRLINAILSEAVKEGASDIHIETFERTLSIRFRVDGLLHPVLQPARKLAPLLVSRIKVMAKLDIAEKRLPQDGRISLRIGRKAIDVRVSTIPSQYGERVVMRLLDKNNMRMDLGQLGLADDDREHLEGLIAKPHGILLVTGPTGSGKSTSLYAVLSSLNSFERNILTVEDPIEYELEGVGQTQVNPRVEMTFARGLRAILRQDPDVVMIGEIRDSETAQIAVQASLTGHLVMSTLHTNSACGAVTRLRDMGLESFLIGSSLLGVIAQRLVRRLCKHCRTTSELSAREKAMYSFLPQPPEVIYRAVGCEHCRDSGYQGRAGIHEFLVMNTELRRAINDNLDEMTLDDILRKHTRSLRQNGLLKVISGETSIEEVIRVTAEQNESGEA
ncbi:type II secretion system ATPase GspE [Budviciaceae bacterium CWB-B4]|uniref:Type II secretion system protein E n=1 Tax=Limnobaculum xujianqingii TaxID=2738837 RepID=A0A9D7AF13_9GAMM|nr:type II secretion system ATPase GspE [Limnobaculum xujianqingii]MBK5071529.1 type II secretion system ATPase GspE [Limnobaculum xujianqingii]MBK5174838.1 type II secretion system ATPase GspE [Limnobaculum xujianqingii]